LKIKLKYLLTSADISYRIKQKHKNGRGQQMTKLIVMAMIIGTIFYGNCLIKDRMDTIKTDIENSLVTRTNALDAVFDHLKK
jgi:hypothetical protein